MIKHCTIVGSVTILIGTSKKKVYNFIHVLFLSKMERREMKKNKKGGIHSSVNVKRREPVFVVGPQAVLLELFFCDNCCLRLEI